MTNAEDEIYESERQKALVEKRKTVHEYVEGKQPGYNCAPDEPVQPEPTPGPWRTQRENGYWMLFAGKQEQRQCIPIIISYDDHCSPKEEDERIIRLAPEYRDFVADFLASVTIETPKHLIDRAEQLQGGRR